MDISTTITRLNLADLATSLYTFSHVLSPVCFFSELNSACFTELPILSYRALSEPSSKEND